MHCYMSELRNKKADGTSVFSFQFSLVGIFLLILFVMVYCQRT